MFVYRTSTAEADSQLFVEPDFPPEGYRGDGWTDGELQVSKYPWPLRARYDYQIERRDGATVVVEKIRLSNVWFLIAGCVAVAAMLGPILGAVGITSAGVVLLTVAALGGVILYPSPMGEELSTEGASVLHADTYRTVYEGPTVVALLAGTLALSTLLIVPIRQGKVEPSLDVQFLVVELLTAGVVVFVRWYENRGLVPSVAPFDLPDQLSVPGASISGGYASLALLTALVPSVVASSDQLFGVFNHYFTADPKVQFGLPLGLLVAAVGAFVCWSLTVNRRFVYQRTLSGLVESDSRISPAVGVAVVFATTAGLLFSLQLFLSTFRPYSVGPLVNGNLYPFVDNPIASLMLAGLLVPMFYFPPGAVSPVRSPSVSPTRPWSSTVQTARGV